MKKAPAPKVSPCSKCHEVTQHGTETATGKCWVCFWVRP